MPRCSLPRLHTARAPCALVACAALAACSGPPPPKQPVGTPPTPASVTPKEPGGDAADPHRAALERLLAAPWGERNDRDDQVRAPMPDWGNWKRVRYFGVEHFTGFRYGDEHHVMAIVFVQDTPNGSAPTSEGCMRRFEDWGRPQTRGFDVKFSPFQAHHSRWRGQPLEIDTVDGSVNLAFTHASFSAAWAAYPAYPNACLIYAVAVPWRDDAELAERLRDRFVSEGFVRFNAVAKQRPPE